MQETKSISTPEKTKRLLIVFVAVFLLCVLYSVITAKKNDDNGCGDWIITQGEDSNYLITQNKRFLTCNNAISIYSCDNSNYCGFYTSSSKSDTILLFDNSHNYSYNVKTGEKKQLPYLGDTPHYHITDIPNAKGEIVGLFVYTPNKQFLYKLETPQDSKHIDYLSGGYIANTACDNVSYTKELLEHNYISCDGTSAYLLDINTFSSKLDINNGDNTRFGAYNTDNTTVYVAVTNLSDTSIPKEHIRTITSSIDLSFLTGNKENSSKYIQFFDSNLQPIVEQGDYYYLFGDNSLIIYGSKSPYYYIYDGATTIKSREYGRVLDVFTSNSLKDKYSTEKPTFFSVIDKDGVFKIVDTRDNVVVSFPESASTDGEYILTLSSDNEEDNSISIVYGGILYNYSIDNGEFSKEDISYITDISKMLFGK